MVGKVAAISYHLFRTATSSAQYKIVPTTTMGLVQSLNTTNSHFAMAVFTLVSQGRLPTICRWAFRQLFDLRGCATQGLDGRLGAKTRLETSFSKHRAVFLVATRALPPTFPSSKARLQSHRPPYKFIIMATRKRANSKRGSSAEPERAQAIQSPLNSLTSPMSKIPHGSRFPLLVVSSLTLSYSLYTIAAPYTSGDLSTVSAHRDKTYEVAFFLVWRALELSIGWYEGFDSKSAW